MTIVQADARGIRTAVRILKSGGTVAFPTETTYGLGCDPRDAKSVRRIFLMKGRDRSKPLLLVAADMKQVRAVADVSHVPKRLFAKWPGPLTLVLPAMRNAGLARGVIPYGEVAIRISSSPFVRRLSRSFGFSIVATSANRSSEPDCRSGRAVERIFAALEVRPDLILDARTLPKRKPSTVARIRTDGTIEVIRQGSVRI